MKQDALLSQGWAAAQPTIEAMPGGKATYPRCWSWLVEDPDRVLRSGVAAGGLVWWAGTPSSGDGVDRLVVAVGHDSATGRARVRVDLGLGLVRDVQNVGDELWLTIARRRFLPVVQNQGVDVIAVSASGRTRIVHVANSIDISALAPALPRPTDEQIQHHVDDVRAKFDNLEAYWHRESGASSPLRADYAADATAVRRPRLARQP